jgi:hypothetical protein
LMLGWALLPEPLGFRLPRMRRSQFAGQSLDSSAPVVLVS